MVWQATAGSTFLLRTGPGHKEHLYFVLNAPTALPGFGNTACITVNASTPHDRCDKTCMVKAGCHPFITHESYIYCSQAQVFAAADLERKVLFRTFGAHDPVGLDLVKYILGGLMYSDHTLDDVRVAAEIVYQRFP